MSHSITASPALTLAEIEALVLFLRDRAALWQRHAKDCGVTDPLRAVKELARVHAQAVKEAKG